MRQALSLLVANVGNESPLRKSPLGPCTGRASEARIVARHDDRTPLLYETGERFHHGSRVCVVEVGGGLVEQEQGRVTQKRAGESDALAFAPRKGTGQRLREMADGEPFQELLGPSYIGCAHAVRNAREKDIFAYGHGVDELVVLEDEADLVAADLGPVRFAEPGSRLAVEQDLSARRRKHRAEEGEERRLAAPARTPE